MVQACLGNSSGGTSPDRRWTTSQIRSSVRAYNLLRGRWDERLSGPNGRREEEEDADLKSCHSSLTAPIKGGERASVAMMMGITSTDAAKAAAKLGGDHVTGGGGLICSASPKSPSTCPFHSISSMSPKDEESPAEYNYGGYLQVKVADSFKDQRYTVVRKLGCVLFPFFVVGPPQLPIVGVTFPPYGLSRTLCTSSLSP